MKKIEESIVIDRSPDEVFEFIDDRTNDPKWMESVLESEWVEEGDETQLGRNGRFVMEAMGRREFTDEVTEFDPGRLVAHRFVSDSMVFHAGCLAEPDESGEKCRFTVTYQPERLPGGILGRIMAPITMRMVRRNYRNDLIRLKKLLESGA